MPLWLRFALFFSMMAVLLAALNVYVHRRARQAFALGRRGRRALAALLATGALSMVLGRAFTHQLGPSAAEALAVFGATIQLAVVIAAALLFLVDLPRALHHLAKKLPHRKPSERLPGGAEGDDPPFPSRSEGSIEAAEGDDPRAGIPIHRRSFLQRTVFGVPLLIGGTTSLYGALVGRHDYAIEEVPVPLAGLSRRLDGYAIVQLSDIHFGTFVDDRELDSAVELVRRAQPDLVVLTGDLVDHDPRYADHLGRLVRRLRPLARDGVTAIAGNHDYYAGIDAVLTMLRRSGARVLVNQGHTLGDAGGAFALLGVDDIWSARNGVGEGPDLGRALSMVPGDLPRVLLCHNPAFFPEAAGEVQLQLSGHTHGGQVNVGVQLAHLVLPYGYVAGRYRRGDSLLYVNRGFGTAGPPARIGATPEVTRVVLTAG